MSIEMNKESVEQADASSCQGTNCGTTTGDHSSECLAEAAAGQGWELKPGDLCGRDCPIHKILAEQAGGDERATLAHRSEFHQHLKECADEVATWPSYKREALTQPAPKCATCNDSGQIVVSGPHYQGEFQPPEYETEPCDMCAQPSPAQAEQAEAERPEVVARVVHSNPVVLGQCGPLNANDELMTVAQHAASVARWAEMFNRVEQERDAALARVVELERQEPVVRAYGALPPFAEKVLAKLRRFYDCAEDFASGGVDIGRHWLDLLTQLGLLNRVQRSPALWEISQQGEDLLEAPVAQAQHSVPEKVRTLLSRAQCEIEHLAECLENVCEDEEDFDVREDVADGRVVAADIAHMLAAAPGKEVGHE
ncbi:TPA: hypothetical protein ACLF0I_003547 [Pseudomonas aeruginosa]